MMTYMVLKKNVHISEAVFNINNILSTMKSWFYLTIVAQFIKYFFLKYNIGLKERTFGVH